MNRSSRKEKYREFLKSRFWQELSAEKRRLVRKCEKCGRKNRLQAHHTFYRPNWWDTKLEDLKVLCWKCHGEEHGFIMVVNGIIPCREDYRFNEFIHRCGNLKRKVLEGGKLRDRDNRFLDFALKVYPPKKKDTCMQFHVNMVRQFEALVNAAK